MTEAFNFSVTYSNGFYTVSQPANANLIFEIPQAKAEIQTHPTLANLFYFGVPSLTLDYTKITNIVPVSRDLTIAYIISLAVTSMGSVAITSLPSNALDRQGSLYATITGNGPFMALRVIAGAGQFIKLRTIDGVSNLGLGTWSNINIVKNPTNAGGTWTAAFAGSIVEKNNLTGFTSSGGVTIWTGSVRSEKIWDLTRLDPTLVNGDVIVVSGLLFATTGVGATLTWNEKS